MTSDYLESGIIAEAAHLPSRRYWLRKKMKGGRGLFIFLSTILAGEKGIISIFGSH